MKNAGMAQNTSGVCEILKQALLDDPSLEMLITDVRRSLMARGANLWDEHSDIVVGIARFLRPHTYVEIGANHGQTFNQVAPLVKRAVAVEQKAGLLKGIISLPHVEKHAMISDEFAKTWEDPIDLLYIDADHAHDASLRDFLNFAVHVPETGLILLHDSYPASKEWVTPERCEEVYKTAWLIKKEMSHLYEIVTLPVEHGISIVRPARKPLHWQKKATSLGPLQIRTTILLAKLLISSLFYDGCRALKRFRWG